jgi:uncharacterized protein
MQRVLRPEYPAGVPCWVDVAAPDLAGATRFYEGLFGWEVDERSPGYLVARLRGADAAGIGSLAPDAPVAWNTYVRVDSAGDAAARVTSAGGMVLHPVRETPGIARVAACADPAGAVFRVYEPAGVIGAQAVNEGGSLNFNELNSDDIEGSTAFYGAVFGWQARPLEFGDLKTTMWCLPGYGDFLESINPGTRQRHREGGAPPDFTDAVGWLQPLAAGDSRPHWSVTFAVDDTEAVAASAERLGGTVTVPPFNAGVAMVGQVQDPYGARFTISQFLG